MLTSVTEKSAAPVCVYHEIVHNTYVVAGFRNRGVRFVETLEEVPEGAVLVFSAHGVSPALRDAARQRNLTVIDATCPLVEQVHQKVRQFASREYRILYIGHPGHDEVTGILAEAPDQITLLADVREMESLEIPAAAKAVCLMQTTLSADETREMLRKWQIRFPQMEIPESGGICYATQNRQNAVRQLAGEADAALIVGSANSSNSRRLCELASAADIPAYLIDGPQEIRPAWLDGSETVLMSAGASVPENIVQECVHFLRNRFAATVEERVIHTENISFPVRFGSV
jgi:4-hydroxy-3-methylbut-2-enyl diphosphate reductase